MKQTCAKHKKASQADETSRLQEVKKAFDWLDQKDLLIDQLTQELQDMEKRYHKLVDRLIESQPQDESVSARLFHAVQEQAVALLNERNDLSAQLSESQSKLADAIADLAVSQRERDMQTCANCRYVSIRHFE